MTTDDIEHTEIQRRIEEVHVQLVAVVSYQTTMTKWAVTLILTVWVSILGYIYRIDVSVIKHMGASQTIVDRLDASFEDIYATIDQVVSLNEKEHDRFRRKLEDCATIRYR